MIKLDRSWQERCTFPEGATQKQKDILTPVILNADTTDTIRKTYAQIFKQTGAIFSPLIFRYSFAIRTKAGKKNVAIVPLYYLEKDLNIALKDYKIVTHVGHIVFDDSLEWLKEADNKVKFFQGNCEDVFDKLILTKIGSTCHGWEVKEKFGK
jgi:hypothetical protein